MTTRFHTAALLLFTACALTACITLTHCSDDKPTGPPPTPPPDTTSHEFVWEVDTLYWDGTTTPVFFTAKAMYAISATNVYMVGYTTGSKEMCWHWDGKQWRVFNVGVSLGNDIADIDGIDSTFIVFESWYNGTQRNTGVLALKNGGLEQLPLPLGKGKRTCVHVATENEIYLGTVDGIQRYDGTKWEWLLDSTETTGYEFEPKYIYKYAEGTLEFVSQRNATLEPIKFNLWRYSSGRFVVIDTFTEFEQDASRIHFAPYLSKGVGGDLFSSGGATFVRKNGQWEKLHDLGGAYVAGDMNNLFIVQRWYNVWHYNGSTLENLWDTLKTLIPTVRRINNAAFVDNVFFVCAELEDTRNVVVYRGRQVKK